MPAQPLHIVMTHENADLDAVAALLGAARLYPGTTPVLPRRVNRNVRNFITLYGADFPFVSVQDLPFAGDDESAGVDIERVILVDTQAMVTLKGMSKNLQVQIIDHHPLGRELKPGWTSCGDEVGAATTLLVEQMIAQMVALSPIEATLFLLGIYEDTGSLSYLTTTPRDVRCAAWLLEHGASLEIANDFLHYPLTPEQHELYERFLESAENHTFAGQSVIISAVEFGRYVEEVSVLAHNLRDLFEPAGLFLIVGFDDQVQLIARSTGDAIDVAEIATAFGGGGHSRASAALIREMTVQEVRARLLDMLETDVHPAVIVRELMSHGVRTVQPSTTVVRAHELMQLYGHEGFPVLDGGRVVGILSRREIDRALRLGLDHAAIDTYMTKGEIVVHPDDSIETVQQMMTERGVGQVPVVSDEGQVLGIVTRTDLINTLFAAQNGTQTPARRREIVQMLEQSLGTHRLGLLWQAADCAHDFGFKLYIVGGFVRDLLLGRPNLDIDLVVEGDAIRLARQLAQQGGGRVRSHARFGTAKWILDDSNDSRPVDALRPEDASHSPESLDFVSARTEFYSHPTALPQVESSSIKQDLHRRDFTINTLALRLDRNHYGELLDFYGGEQDLRDGVVRVLHSLSFVEDPTRILRAVRLEQRLGFHIETRTRELIDSALPLLARVSGERIRHELYLLLQETAPESGLCRMETLGVLRQIHPALVCNGWVQLKFQTLREVLGEWYEADWKPRVEEEEYDALHGMLDPQDNIAQLYLALLTYRLIEVEVETLIARIKIVSDDAYLLRQVTRLRGEVESLQVRNLSPSQVYDLLEPFSGPAILVTWIASDSERVRAYLTRYWQVYRHIHPILTGEDLKAMGLAPGPVFGQILHTLRAARLDEQLSTREEELVLVRRWLAES
ncbi:MAG: CBS domain-containing protein [Anaerolineae bacterium]|nr:CBS domain-containing protein [Anaerolineae bacterium]